MSKNFIYKFCCYLLILIAPILWLLKVIFPAQFGWYNLSLCVGIVTAGIGLMIILKQLLSKGNTVLKKFNIFVGGGLGIISVFCFVSAFALPKNIIAPIICIIVAACLMLGLLATGAKKWDEGDNNKVGYKNYYQRKAEEEKKEKEEIIIE